MFRRLGASIRKWMYGRYGSDQLNMLLLVLAVIIAAVVLFVRGLSRRMQGRLRFLSRSSNSRGKHMGEKKGRRDRKVQAAEEQTEKAVEEQTENRKTLEEQTEKMQKEKE